MRQPETCNWILGDPQTQPWIEDEGGDPILWVTGIPGSGKSFLCSLIIEHLQTRMDRSSLYYFCGKQAAGGDTRAIILRTLAVQLLQQNPGMVPLVHQAYFQRISNRSGPALETLLKEVLPTVKVTRIVVDGIDECDSEMQKEVLRSLVKIQKTADCNCKLLVSSRQEPQIQGSLLPKNHMRLGQKTCEALSVYIRDKVTEVQAHFPDMDVELSALVKQRLTSKADGMFLGVRLVVAMLTQQVSEEEVEGTIDQLPDGLEEAYGFILSRFKTTALVTRERVFKILYWVCVAYRPIKIHEVVDAIALRPTQTILNRKTRSNNPTRDIVELCAPLLEISSSGVLSLVHFSAKEYLVDKQSGPFIDVIQAHLSISLSCIINLTSCLDLLPGYRSDLTSIDLETRVVQGSYGLHSYGHEFWANHVLAYLAHVKDLDGGIETLIGSLQNFSAVNKHPTEHIVSLPFSVNQGNTLLGLAKLKQVPALSNLISGWLFFKSTLHEAKRNFDNLDAQEQWQLQKDVTYLTIIASSLSKLTERLLMMRVSELPSHIDKRDFMAFSSRFDLPCRFLDCNNTYRSVQDRETHERSHMPSFPCLQCDFAVRGFKSRRDLEKHIQKYHMSPADFEIPADLHSAIDHPRGGATTLNYPFSRMSSCWNEQGRKALQRGFSQVLARIESCRAPGSETSLDISHNADLDNIHEKLETQQYDSLTDFKIDLHSLSTISESTAEWIDGKEMRSFCDEEFEKAVSEYPNFATLYPNAHESGRLKTMFGTVVEPKEYMEVLDGQERDVPSLESPFTAGRRPYWSIAEEKRFPELLQRCGRDFLKIADHLKTKTVDEVDQHLVELLHSGRTDLLALADLADSRVQEELEGRDTVTEDVNNEIGGHTIDHTNGNISINVTGPSQPLGLTSPYIPQLEDLSSHGPMHLARDSALKRTRTVSEADTTPNESTKRKRKPRRRAVCNFCSAELHDEYAVKKHVSRFHNAVRRVWICEDISIDKGFLSKCKPCLASKRYSSQNNTSQHLRQAHFNTDTSAEILHRWMRETEEPNPTFQTSNSESPSISRQIPKRQKTGKKLHPLAPILTEGDSPKLLPSIMLQPSELSVEARLALRHNRLPSSSSEEDEDDEESPNAVHLDEKFFNHGDLLPDVSFDNVLPGLATPPSVVDSDGPPHRTNRTLIKPDQVHRLPHLKSSRRIACQDQVTTLYQRLDKEPVGSARYKDDLDSLISLSQMLMNDLRDWRRHETFAPELPFSI